MPGSEDVKLTSSVISTNLLNSNDKPITGSNRLYYVYLYFINDGNEDVGWVSKNKVIIGSQPLVLDFTKDFKVDE
ncbi:MAG: hypothetical protein LBB98_08965 [Treponema sp.]|jgi:hypothetical protein|nr:hypothetical protein [Treponema sp.]